MKLSPKTRAEVKEIIEHEVVYEMCTSPAFKSMIQQIVAESMDYDSPEFEEALKRAVDAKLEKEE